MLADRVWLTVGTLFNLKRVQWNTSLEERKKQATQRITNCPTNIETFLQLLKTTQLAQTFLSLEKQTLWIDLHWS